MIDSMQEQEQALTPLLVVGLEASGASYELSYARIICGFHSNFKNMSEETRRMRAISSNFRLERVRASRKLLIQLVNHMKGGEAGNFKYHCVLRSF